MNDIVGDGAIIVREAKVVVGTQIDSCDFCTGKSKEQQTIMVSFALSVRHQAFYLPEWPIIIVTHSLHQVEFTSRYASQSVDWNNRQYVGKRSVCKSSHNSDRAARNPERQTVFDMCPPKEGPRLSHRWVVVGWTFAVFDAGVSKKISKPAEDI